MKYVNRYLTITFVSIISLLTSCTYDYEYPTEDGIKMTIDAVTIDWNGAQLKNDSTVKAA